MAARLRRELKTEVELVRGPYGQFKVFVDGQTAVDAGGWAALGIASIRSKGRRCGSGEAVGY